MLAGIRALVFPDQRRSFFGNCAHFLRTVAAHVEYRPHMQATHRSMRIPGAAGAVLVEYLGQAVGVFSEMFQRYCAVLDKRHRFAVAFHRHHDVEAGLAHFPEFLLHGRIDDFDDAARQATFPHQCHQILQAANLLVAILTGEFHQQDRLGLAFHALVDDRSECRIATRKIDHRAVDQFHRCGFQLDDVLRRLHRLVERREMTHAQRLVSRQRRQFQFEAPRKCQRAL